MNPEYRSVTDGIEVTVRTYFLEDQSDLDQGPWVWAYQVRISNQGRENGSVAATHLADHRREWADAGRAGRRRGW